MSFAVPERVTRLKSNQISNGTYLFKLGNENSFKSYVNQYTSNPLALNKPQRNEERDKKRYISHKFSLSSGQEFKWVGLLNGNIKKKLSFHKLFLFDNILIYINVNIYSNKTFICRHTEANITTARI